MSDTEAAVQAERDQWAGAVDEAIENGAQAGRARCAAIIKTWAAGLKGSEYLSRSTAILVSKIESGK